MKDIQILSLFNGMGTLREAFEQLGYNVVKSYSSEIKPYANKLVNYHYPDTVQLGNIINWRKWNINWHKLDFIGSGSPCQDLSAIGNRSGINGSKSSLFFVFVEILNHAKKFNPKVKFLQENVASANPFDIGIISRELGVYPVQFNSSDILSANRDRFFWSNIRTKKSLFDFITDIPPLKKKHAPLYEIIENGFVDREKANCLLESNSRPFNKNEFAKIYKRHNKAFETCIFESSDFDFKKGVRIPNKRERCKMQGFEPNYCDILTENEAASVLGDGWSLPVIVHILSYINQS